MCPIQQHDSGHGRIITTAETSSLPLKTTTTIGICCFDDTERGIEEFEWGTEDAASEENTSALEVMML